MGMIVSKLAHRDDIFVIDAIYRHIDADIAPLCLIKIPYNLIIGIPSDEIMIFPHAIDT